MLLSSSLFFFLFSAPGFATSQYPANDTLSSNSLLYSGTEYTKIYTQDTGDPFFPSDSTLGTIRFNGNWYLNQDFYYDCEDDAIILKDREGYFRIELIREKTESFQLAGHRFVKLKLLSPYGEFYEEAFKGKRTLLVRWKKTLETNNEAMNKYKLTKQFFVMYDEKSFEIKKANDLFDILGNQAKPARHWMKAQGINLKKDMLAGILSTFQHFESLGW